MNKVILIYLFLLFLVDLFQVSVENLYLPKNLPLPDAQQTYLLQPLMVAKYVHIGNQSSIRPIQLLVHSMSQIEALNAFEYFHCLMSLVHHFLPRNIP